MRTSFGPAAILAALAVAGAAPAAAATTKHHHHVDHSARPQVGKASYYARTLTGAETASGKTVKATAMTAASKTLPIGTVAKVTNVRTGKTAVVTVEDRGPFVDGRTVDLTRHTAQEIGITRKEGVAPVVVAPVAVPQPDGSIKPGAGAVPGPATGQ